MISAITNVDYTVNVNNKKKVFHINMWRKFFEHPEFLKKMLMDEPIEEPQ